MALASCTGDGMKTEMGVESMIVSSEGFGSDADVDEEDERRAGDGK